MSGPSRRVRQVALVNNSKFNAHHGYVSDNIEVSDLYDCQKAALRNLADWFRHDSGKPSTAIVVLPTGAGKSGVAAITPYMLNSSRVLVITPSVIITTQLASDFWGEGGKPCFYRSINLIDEDHQVANFVEHGKMCVKSLGSDLDGADRMTVAQKAAGVKRQFEARSLVIANCHKFGPSATVNIDDLVACHNLFDLVIVDEAHHYPAPTWTKIIDSFQNVKKVFLTATPENRGQAIIHENGKRIDLADQEARYVAYRITHDDAVEAGLIRELDFIEMPVEPGTDNSEDPRNFIKVVDQMLRELDQHDREARRDGRPHIQYQGMILTYRRDYADKVRDTINARVGAVVAGSYHGTNNEAVFTSFKAGRLRILVTCGKACEGFDRKNVSVVGILRNVAPSSRVLFTQFVGRAVRKLYRQENIRAKVISHVLHKQRPNFDSFDQLAEVDPNDDEVDWN